jgi:hypothetical protein
MDFYALSLPQPEVVHPQINKITRRIGAYPARSDPQTAPKAGQVVRRIEGSFHVESIHPGQVGFLLDDVYDILL